MEVNQETKRINEVMKIITESLFLNKVGPAEGCIACLQVGSLFSILAGCDKKDFIKMSEELFDKCKEYVNNVFESNKTKT